MFTFGKIRQYSHASQTHKSLITFCALCSVDIPIFWRDLCLTLKRTRSKRVLGSQHPVGDAPRMVVWMWTSLTRASLQYSGPPWIELALPYILELQDTMVRSRNPGSMAPSVASAYLTCYTTNGPQKSSRFTTIPAQLAPLVAWLRAPEQHAWGESIYRMLLRRFDAAYLQAGLVIATWGYHQLQDGRSRLCCCSVPADHAEYLQVRSPDNDLTKYDWVGQQGVTDFLSALLLHRVSLPSVRLVILQGRAVLGAAAAEAAAAEAAAAEEEEAEAAFVAAVAAGAEAGAKAELVGRGHSMEPGTAELVGISAGEMGSADVQLRRVRRVRGEPASPGSERAGAAPAPAAGGTQLAAEGVGESQQDAARVGEGAGCSDGGGGGGGGRAAAVQGKGVTAAETQAAAEGEGGTETTVAAGGGAGEG